MMPDPDRFAHQSSEAWRITKPAVEAAGGLVATQHYLASDAGAAVLADGGNAVDAAVAASFAIGTVEPWMSGLGGGGYMLVRRRGEARAQVVDFGMIAARGADPADYPLSGKGGGDLFGWPGVVDDRNLRGYLSMAVPGQVAGLALALETFGTKSWPAVIAPAIALAETGMPVDWYGTLAIAADAPALAGYEASKAIYLPGGFPPCGAWSGEPPRISLEGLAWTLRRLAEAGPRDFYDGEIARRMAADLAEGGARLGAADLSDYTARLVDAATAPYRDATVWVAPGLTAGPTLLHALDSLAGRLTPGDRPDAAAYHAYASCMRAAYAERLSTMGDAGAARSPDAQTCTSHLSVVDRDGTVVALTQTLLSPFGSKVVLPRTGVLMNNGVMWFDPRPGRANSIGPGKRPLSNMCPTAVERGDGLSLALGASGGRRIFPAVFQLVSFLVDYGMSLDAAMRCGRVDASTEAILIDDALPAEVDAAIAADFDTERVTNGVYPVLFACPNAAGHDAATGRSVGASFVTSPRAKASAAP